MLRRGHRTSTTNSTYGLVSVVHFSTTEVQMGLSCWYFLPTRITNLPAELRITANLRLLLPGTILFASDIKLQKHKVPLWMPFYFVSSRGDNSNNITNPYKIAKSILQNLGYCKHAVLPQCPAAGNTRARHIVYNCRGSQLHLTKEKPLVACIPLKKIQSSCNCKIRLLPPPNTSYSILTVIFTVKI